jgi:hypothetical protein
VWVLGTEVSDNGTTGMTFRRSTNCGIIGCSVFDVNNVHGNCVSIYDGDNENIIVLFNYFRNFNDGSTGPGFVAHGLRKALLAFNTAIHAGPQSSSTSAITFSQHTPNSTTYRPGGGSGNGDGPFNVWANNIALNSLKVAYNMREAGNPGSMLVNNIVDTLAYNGLPIGDAWPNLTDEEYATADIETQAAFLRPKTRGFNVWTRDHAQYIGAANRAALNEIVITGDNRTALFVDLANDDVGPADPILFEGHSWSFSHPLLAMSPVQITWRGRSRPDGTDAVNWRDIPTFGGLTHNAE